MKKLLWIMASLMLGLVMVTACGSDSDDNDNGGGGTGEGTQLATTYFTIQNATYQEGSMPAATSSDRLYVETPATVQKGGTSTIYINTYKRYQRFFVSVKGVPGYYVYTPTEAKSRATDDWDDDDDDDDWDDDDDDDDEFFYAIPVQDAGGNASSYTIAIAGEDTKGQVSQPYEATISYADRQSSGRLTSVRSATGAYLYTLTYDSQNRVVAYADPETEMAINYNGGMSIVMYDGTQYDDNGKEIDDNITYSVTTNSQGFITRMSGKGYKYSDEASLTYDGDGHLIAIHLNGNDDGEHFSSSAEWEWENGNLVRATYAEDSEMEGITLKYDGQPNAANQWSFMLVQATAGWFTATGLLGNSSAQLPVTATMSDYTFTFSYERNADGTISSETVARDDMSVSLTYNYDGVASARMRPAKAAKSGARRGIARLLF